MGKISVNNELKMKEEWDSGFHNTNTESEGNKEGVEKGKCLFSQNLQRKASIFIL